MEINLPRTILSNEIGYTYLIGIFNRCSVINDTKVTFDFKELVFIEANLCSLLGCILEKLRENKCEYHFIGLKDDVKTILYKNNFWNHYFGENRIEDNYNTTIQYKSFHKTDEDDAYEVYVIDELLEKKDFPKMSETLTAKILENIFEVFANAKTHGKCEYIHACGQYFPNARYKPLNFTVVDLGVNIKENINMSLNKDLSSCESIEWAMVEGNTTKIDEPGGLGLSVILQFIKLNQGKFEVISSDGYYKLSKGISKTFNLESEFPGTIINFTFNLNDENSYILKD